MQSYPSDLSRHRREVDTLRGILRILNSNRSLDEILTHIAAQPAQLLACDACAIYCMDKYGQLFIQASEGLERSLALFDQSVGQDVFGGTTLTQQPIIVADCVVLLAEPWVQQDSARVNFVQQLMKHYRAFVAIPLVVDGEMRGALMVYYQEPHAFAEEEINLIVAFGDQAALALENTWLHEQMQRVAVTAERDRLSRDLHDSVTQTLYGITLYTEAATRLLASGNVETAADHLRQMGDMAQEGLREMRLLIFDLRSPLIAEQGLIGALQTRLEMVEARSGLHADLQVSGVVAPPVTISEALYRIAHEALNNVLKHAQARTVCVRLEQHDSRLILQIVDDGVGFDRRTQARGFGLLGIAERVQALNGTFSIQGDPGTTLRVEIPLSADGVVVS